LRGDATLLHRAVDTPDRAVVVARERVAAFVRALVHRAAHLLHALVGEPRDLAHATARDLLQPVEPALVALALLVRFAEVLAPRIDRARAGADAVREPLELVADDREPGELVHHVGDDVHHRRHQSGDLVDTPTNPRDDPVPDAADDVYDAARGVLDR